MGGPVLSILVHDNEESATFNKKEAWLINIDNQTPERLKTNWHIMISAGLKYQITNKFGLTLEPVYRQYLKPVYDVSQNKYKSPYSLGINGGVIFKF